MKTPMQELLDKINNEEFDHLDDCKMFIQEYMLEKEKMQIMDAYMEGGDWEELPQPRFDNYLTGK
jgi:hypothetical protein